MSTSLNKAAIEAEAELLVAFVNTRDVEEETDSIADPDLLAAWIAEKTGEHAGELDRADADRVLNLRESLRKLLRANNGEEVDRGDLVPLREAAERTRLRTSFSADGRLDLAPARSGLSGFEARLLLAVERLQSLAAWPRLKACTDEECQWAFFDATRNHSRTWCSMDVCGNREKTRRYRERKGAGS
ncbi:MAG TPA: CGNR zinc finger domain-containing protein [Solirubrobacterales bacterium]|nr:CGNR zinc finger domain-containing protein [Solirubrobacterales bacterium]